MNVMKNIAWVVVAALASACTAGVKSIADAGGSDITPGVDQSTTELPPRPASDSGPLPSPDPNPISCSKPQHILILDFRSGWWNGSGGGGAMPYISPPTGFNGVDAGGYTRDDAANGFSPTIFPLIANSCPGTRLEYHHFLADPWGVLVCNYPAPAGQPMCVGSPTSASVAFGESDWNNYSQIWVLSGSELDVSDITAASALFKKIITASKTTCLPFFVGLGSGFVDHGNRVGELLGIGEIATTNLAKPNFWVYRADAVAVSTIKRTELRTHVLFSGVDFLADVIKHDVGDATIEGDALIDNPLVEVIAKDNANRPSIGVGRIAATQDLKWGRPFVLDAGMQRFFLVGRPEHKGTLQYLRNLTNYLGSVGCKSDEKPIIVP